MNQAASFLGGAAIGALAMYMLDPDRGRSRRALVKDKTVRLMHVKREAFGKMARDIKNHTQGLMHDAQAIFKGDDAEDEVVAERVRSKIGRSIRHPGAVEVEISGGTAHLRGLALASEIQDLIRCVEHVRGVNRVVNEVEVHSSPDGISALQGNGKAGRHGLDVFSEHWKPRTSLVMGVAGGALAFYGAARKDRTGAALGAVGLSLLVRSFQEMEGRRLFAADEPKAA